MSKNRTLEDLDKIADKIQQILFDEKLNLTSTEVLYVLSLLQGSLIGTLVQSVLEKSQHYGISG